MKLAQGMMVVAALALGACGGDDFTGDGSPGSGGASAGASGTGADGGEAGGDAGGASGGTGGGGLGGAAGSASAGTAGAGTGGGVRPPGVRLQGAVAWDDRGSVFGRVRAGRWQVSGDSRRQHRLCLFNAMRLDQPDWLRAGADLSLDRVTVFAGGLGGRGRCMQVGGRPNGLRPRVVLQAWNVRATMTACSAITPARVSRRRGFPGHRPPSGGGSPATHCGALTHAGSPFAHSVVGGCLSNATAPGVRNARPVRSRPGGANRSVFGRRAMEAPELAARSRDGRSVRRWGMHSRSVGAQ